MLPEHIFYYEVDSTTHNLLDQEWKNVVPDLIWNPSTIVYTMNISKPTFMIGYTLLNINSGVCSVKELLIKEAFRHKGFGLQFLSEIEHVARKCNCHKVTIKTSEKHVEALGLYKKAGYTIEATYHNDLGNLTWFRFVKFI